MENNMHEHELGWDDEITADSEKEYVLLPEGTYDFIIKSPIKRTRTSGKGKIPASNAAVVTLTISYNGTNVSIPTTLILYSTLEWKLSAFFECIGLKKKGEPLRMQWNNVVGKGGKCVISHREYNGSTYNNVERFVVPEAPAAQPSSSQQWGGGSWS